MHAALLLVAAALAADPAPPPTDLATLDESQFQIDMVDASMLREACDAGQVVSCHRIGRRVEHGLGGLKAAPAEAVAWYRKGCEGGVTPDCGLAANLLARVGDGAAWALARKGCDAGDAVGCFVLGHCELVGIGVAASPSTGLARVQKSCDAGVSAACAELGMVYAGAVPGVPLDYAKAIPLLEAACGRDDVASCGWLGSLVLAGNAGPVDGARGVSLMQKACDGGLGIACEGLGAAYLKGIGVSADAAKGVSFVTRACDLNMPASCAHLAILTAAGDAGLSPDRARALGYARKACGLGHAPACAQLDEACRSGASDACR